jgi:hypothetical protein
MLKFKVTKCEIDQHLKQPSQYANECHNFHGNFDKRRSLFDLNGQLIYSEI